MTVLVCPVTAGVIQLSTHDRHYVATWHCDEVKIEPYKDKRDRTLRQNSYLWGVVYTIIAAETGHTTEEIHEWCKWHFLPRRYVTVGSKTCEAAKSTTTLSTDEFSKYVEQVRAFAGAELSISIPDPQP